MQKDEYRQSNESCPRIPREENRHKRHYQTPKDHQTSNQCDEDQPLKSPQDIQQLLRLELVPISTQSGSMAVWCAARSHRGYCAEDSPKTATIPPINQGVSSPKQFCSRGTFRGCIEQQWFWLCGKCVRQRQMASCCEFFITKVQTEIPIQWTRLNWLYMQKLNHLSKQRRRLEACWEHSIV